MPNLIITATVKAATGGAPVPGTAQVINNVIEVRIKNTGVIEIFDSNSKHYEYDVSAVTTMTVAKTAQAVAVTVTA